MLFIWWKHVSDFLKHNFETYRFLKQQIIILFSGTLKWNMFQIHLKEMRPWWWRFLKRNQVIDHRYLYSHLNGILFTQSIFICEIFRKCDLLLILLMFILHMEIYLSTLLMVMFTGGFELYVPGPGCVSTSPIIRINCNTNNRKTILISGIVLWRRNRDKTRDEHRKLVNIICWYDSARKSTSPYRHLFSFLSIKQSNGRPVIL